MKETPIRNKEMARTNKIKIAWAIKQVRTEILEMSRERLAKVVGISRMRVSQLEGGKIEPLTSTLFRLEKALGDGFILKVYNYYVEAEEKLEWIKALHYNRQRKNVKLRTAKRINKKMKMLEENENNA